MQGMQRLQRQLTKVKIYQITPVIFKNKKKKIGKKGNGEGNNKGNGVIVMKMRYLLEQTIDDIKKCKKESKIC